jgi:hypothetical protein
VWLRADEAPPRVGRRCEARDDVVVATELPRRGDHEVLSEDRVWQGQRMSGVNFAVDEREDLASLLVHADDPRRVESFSFEKSQERVDRRCPRPGSATHGVADANGVVEIPAERTFFGHR